MSQFPNSALRTLSGEGRPRVSLSRATSVWTSFGTCTIGSTTVAEAPAATVNISSSSTTNTINTSTAHGLAVGDRVLIAGHTSTPDINGHWKVTKVVDSDTVQLNCYLTVGGVATGTIRKVPNLTGVWGGMRVVGTVTRSGQPVLESEAMVVSVDRDSAYTITIDEWTNGTPTSANGYKVNGFILRLPYCKKLTETFEPDQLLHELWRGRVESKWFGWKYKATLDYSTHLRGEDLLYMTRMLNLVTGDNLSLRPREDTYYSYPVVYDGAVNVELFGISGGHQGVRFQFRGRELVQFPTVDGGYGYGYGLDYGYQL